MIDWHYAKLRKGEKEKEAVAYHPCGGEEGGGRAAEREKGEGREGIEDEREA
jgi:hypothetical protein